MFNFSKLNREDWYMEHIDALPFYITFSAHGFTAKYKDSFLKYPFIIYYEKQQEIDWCTLCRHQKIIATSIIKRASKDNNYFSKLYLIWKKDFTKIFSHNRRLLKVDFSKLSNKELVDLSHKYYKFYTDIHFPGFLDAFMFYADCRLYELLTVFYAKKKMQESPQQLFAILTAPIEPSFIAKAEKELYEIAVEFLSKGYKKENLKKFANVNLEQRINNYLKKYFWLKSSYLGYKQYTKDDVLEDIENIIKENKIPSKEYLYNKARKKRILKKYSFSAEIKTIISLTELFVKWQDERKIYTLSHTIIDDKFLVELSKRTGIKDKLLKYLTLEEIGVCLDSKITERELIKRANGSLFIYQNGRLKEVVTGKKAAEFYKKFIKTGAARLKEVTGMVASMGRAQGRARIIEAISDINKVSKGDILVTGMTRPEHLPAMKKAVAIVTDDGGITCHAAIISRELKIPCVIGTGIATKVFKDGDLVEVDAERGIVRRI